MIQHRELEEWMSHYLSDFPHSGVPFSKTELLCCQECRTAEDSWFNETCDAIEPLEAKPYAEGWVQCPGCGIRFSTKDQRSFKHGMHISCGQKIHVVD